MLQMEAAEGSQLPPEVTPPGVSTRRVDLPDIDIVNVRSNLSKGGAALSALQCCGLVRIALPFSTRAA